VDPRSSRPQTDGAFSSQVGLQGDRVTDRMFQVIVAGGVALAGCGGALRSDGAVPADGAASPADAAITSNDASAVSIFPSDLPALPIDASIPPSDSITFDLDSGLDAYADAAADARIGVPTEGPPPR
jgi:hypothetical protein